MEILINRGDYAQIMGDVDVYVKGLIEARNEFAKFFCRERGWEIDELTEDQVDEIRKHPDWYRPDIRILPWGHLTELDEQMLMQYSIGANIAIDIGTFLGRSAAVLSRNARTVYTIDSYKDPNFGGCYHNFKTVQRRLQAYKNIVCEVKSSTLWYESNSLDVVFIDGDHSHTGVSYDYMVHIDVVKSGGYILFHDSVNVRVHPDVVKFVNELKENDSRLRFIEAANGEDGSITVFIKK